MFPEERHTTRINFEEPEFLAPIHNLTVPVGREAVLSCTVSNLGNYKVGRLALFALLHLPARLSESPKRRLLLSDRFYFVHLLVLSFFYCPPLESDAAELQKLHENPPRTDFALFTSSLTLKSPTIDLLIFLILY